MHTPSDSIAAWMPLPRLRAGAGRFHPVMWTLLLALVALALGACGSTSTRVVVDSPDKFTQLRPVSLDQGERLRVVATTTIVGDVVAQVGGEHIDLHVLLPPGVDPHSYQPTPRDLEAVSQAHVIFINGLGLETFLERLLQNAPPQTPVISLSAGISPRQAEHDETEADADHPEEGVDPHVWLSVPLVRDYWVPNVAQALAALDPAHAADYEANAARYREVLTRLDTEIRQMVARIPPERRILVTDHDVFGYFAQEYGFRIVGTVIPSVSTLAEPSARQLAQLQEQIRTVGVSAIVVGSTVSPALVSQLAEDLGIQVVTVYTGSLTGPEGPAPTYVDYMRVNVTRIVEALGGSGE